jgi:hypothetical protein
MSINAFYDAYSATQNALGDPRGDAERRRQQEMQNAMQQRQMQMREFEFGQTQAEAQRAEQARQAQMARQRAQMQFRGGSMYPSQQPQQAAPVAPMTGGAPIEQAQGQAFVDPATGQEGASYTATAMQRGPAPTQEEELDFLMRDAYNRSDETGFNQYFDQRRQNMSAEEKAGRQQIAVVAGQILRLPADQRAQAVMQALQQFGVDPSTTKIDDYINNPAQLEQALRFEMVMGSFDKAAEENIRVQGTFDQFRPFERQDLGGSIASFDPRTGAFGQGPKVTVSPNTVATTATQLQLARMNNAARQRIAKIQANTTMSEGEKNRVIKQEELGIRRREAEMGMPQGAPLSLNSSQQGSGINWDDEEPQEQ